MPASAGRKANNLARFIEDTHVVVALPEVQSDGQFTSSSFLVFIRREIIHPPSHSYLFGWFLFAADSIALSSAHYGEPGAAQTPDQFDLGMRDRKAVLCRNGNLRERNAQIGRDPIRPIRAGDECAVVYVIHDSPVP